MTGRVVGVSAADRRRARRRFVLLVVGAVAVGLALRIAIGLTDDAPSSDETAYLSSGVSILEGEGFQRDTRPELHFPPFVPFVLGLASQVVTDAHSAAVTVTILTGTAIIVPLALLARRLAGRNAGIATAWIAALAPGLATMPATRGTGSENEYTLLVVTALLTAAVAADRRGAARVTAATATGLLTGLAYLARPEGLILAVPLGIALVVVARRGADGRRAKRRAAGVVGAAFVLPLVLCATPYVLFLHSHTGEWGLTAKTQDASIEAWHAVARGDRMARDDVLYALDESGLDFAAERSSLTELARDDPSGYLRILGTNVVTLVKNVLGLTLLPLPAWVMAGVGAWHLRRSRLVRLLLVVGALPVLSSLAFFVQPRYLAVTAALGTVLVGVGLVRVRLPRRFPVAVGVMVPVVLASALAFRGDAGWLHPADHTDQRLAGEWIAAHTDVEDRVMTRSMVVDFYSERPIVAMPDASLEAVLRFARHYGVQYLVADQAHMRRLRPQLTGLLEDDVPPDLLLVQEVAAEGRTARVFALDPPPLVPEAPGPSLGFMGDDPAAD